MFDCRRRRRRNDLFEREDIEGEEECARDTAPRLSMSVWVAWRWATGYLPRQGTVEAYICGGRGW